MRVRFFAVAGACAVLGLGFTACGDDDDDGGGGNKVSGNTLTIYSSLPLQGTSRAQSTAVINGEKLALEELAPGGKLGKYQFHLREVVAVHRHGLRALARGLGHQRSERGFARTGRADHTQQPASASREPVQSFDQGRVQPVQHHMPA